MYKPEYCQLLLEHSAEEVGNNFTTFAAMIGTHREVLHEWGRKHEDFANARKRAKEIQESLLMKLGVTGMRGNLKAFHNAAWIFMMKARHGWSDDGPQDQEQGDLEFV